MNFIEWLKGKKTYFVAGIFLILVLVPLIFTVAIPEWVFGILGGIGLATFRAAISEISGNPGWKTYAAAVCVAVISVCSALGVALPYDVIYGILAALGIVGVRSAVEKI